MIDVKQKYWIKVISILKKHFNQEKVFIYGSRTQGKARAHSDLDIGVLGVEKISLNKLALADEDFAASDIPFRVEILDLQRCTASFRKKIEREGIAQIL